MDSQPTLSTSNSVLDVLDLTPLETTNTVPAVITDAKPPATIDNPVEEDYDLARKNMKEILDTGHKALEDLAIIASASQSARAYEVLTGLIQTLNETNKDLLELLKRKKDIESKDGSAEGKTINNNLFVGSSAELLTLIKKNNGQ